MRHPARRPARRKALAELTLMAPPGDRPPRQIISSFRMIENKKN
jgi:hypothetical protein